MRSKDETRWHRRRAPLGVASGLAVVAAVPAASAETYVVEPENDDEISDALQDYADKVEQGETVKVGEGEYKGFDLHQSGTSAEPIVFSADPGAVIVESNERTEDGINLEGASHVVVEGFEVFDMPRDGIRAVECEDVVIRQNRIAESGRNGLLTGFCDDLAIEDNVSLDAERSGIYIGNSPKRPEVRGNEVAHNRLNGIQLNGDRHLGGSGIVTDARIAENVIYGNGDGGGSGINADGVLDSLFKNNLLYDNKSAGISLFRIDGGDSSQRNVVINNTIVMPDEGRPGVQIRDRSTDNAVLNNILYHEDPGGGALVIEPNSRRGVFSDHNVLRGGLSMDGGGTMISLAEWQGQTGHDANSFSASAEELFDGEELLHDPVARDYWPAADSPALHAAHDEYSPAHDLVGTARPVGEGVDIGAYEHCDDDCEQSGGEANFPDMGGDDGDDDSGRGGPPDHAGAPGGGGPPGRR